MNKYLDRNKLVAKLEQQKAWYNSENSFFNNDMKVHLTNSVNALINQINSGNFDVETEESETYVSWLPEEDLYCVNRFIENYFEKLIKYGQTINNEKMELEVKLYIQSYGHKRTDDSVKLKFHNIEYLAFKWVEDHGNPYNVEIKKGMSQRSEQSFKFWEQQTKQYSETILKWLERNISNQEVDFFDIEVKRGSYLSWLPEEDLWCVNRFIENYFEGLIKFGHTINSKEMDSEIKLYQQRFGNNRRENSIILKFRNVEHLGFNLIIERNNPYKVKIKKGMTSKTKQSIGAWKLKTKEYSNDINKWFNNN